MSPENMNMPDQNKNQNPLGLRSDVPLGTIGGDPKWYKNKKTLSIVIGIVVLLIIIGVAAYAGLRPGSSNEEDGDRNFGSLPLGGEREEQEEEVSGSISGLSGRTCEGADRRPIGVMLAADPINRPVSGFAKADFVYELPVLVSDVTRLLAVYQCGRPDDIGSVRSVRHDYLFLGDGLDAIVAHWGGSYHALNRIAVGEFQTLNALSNPHNAFFRKNNLPAPYNGFTTYDRLWNALEKLGYRTKTEFKGYEFKDDAAQAERGAAGTLAIGWPGAFRVSYEYNPSTNRYERYWAGVRQVDGGDNAPVEPSVVVIMRAANGPAEGPGGYNDMEIEGEGALEVYQDGQVIKGRWKKNVLNKRDPVEFLNEAGEPIVFTRGQVWVMAVEPNISVTWTPAAGTAAPAQ